MQNKGELIKQKLSQNGFNVQDLASQSGLSVDQIEQVIKTGEADEETWNIILDTFNQYPALYAPADDLLAEIKGQILQSSADDPCTIFYGVNQSDLLFVAVQFADLSVQGANVDLDYLHRLDNVTLGQALALFEAQADAIANASAHLKD